jgi:hypothetical protein
MYRLFERIEHAHGKAVAQQRVGGMRSDETGTTS